MNVGRAIRLLRVAADLTQKELAERLGRTSNYISLVECGERTPSLDFVEDAAHILGVPVSHLFALAEGETIIGEPSKRNLFRVLQRAALLLADEFEDDRPNDTQT